MIQAPKRAHRCPEAAKATHASLRVRLLDLTRASIAVLPLYFSAGISTLHAAASAEAELRRADAAL